MPLIRKDTIQPGAPRDVASDLLAALKSDAPDTRWSAARGLAATPDGVEALAEALRAETDPRVREAMFTSLARIGTPRSVAVAAPYLRSDDAGVRTAALDALRAMPQAARAELPALLEDPEADVRLLACEIVRGLPGPDALDLIAALLERETEVNVCAAAVEVVAEIGDATILPTLRRCAERFAPEPFLVFAIKVASDRIGPRAEDARG